MWGWVGPCGRPGGDGIAFLQDVSQGNRTRASMKDSVAQIGLDKWTSRDRGEKLGEKSNTAYIPERSPNMSLKPQGLEPIPQATSRLAHKSSPKGTAIMRLRDALGPI